MEIVFLSVFSVRNVQNIRSVNWVFFFFFLGYSTGITIKNRNNMSTPRFLTKLGYGSSD